MRKMLIIFISGTLFALIIGIILVGIPLKVIPLIDDVFFNGGSVSYTFNLSLGEYYEIYNCANTSDGGEKCWVRKKQDAAQKEKTREPTLAERTHYALQKGSRR